jgi:hypothetical protein
LWYIPLYISERVACQYRLPKGNGENLFDHEEHEGVEGVETTGKNIFTMKDMKSLKG